MQLNKRIEALERRQGVGVPRLWPMELVCYHEGEDPEAAINAFLKKHNRTREEWDNQPVRHVIVGVSPKGRSDEAH